MDCRVNRQMNQRILSKRDFTLLTAAWLLSPLCPAQAQVKVIGTHGQGMEGEVTSTLPRSRPSSNAVPPAGSAPLPTSTVLIIGDSLSAEYGLARGKGWVNLLAQKLQSYIHLQFSQGGYRVRTNS